MEDGEVVQDDFLKKKSLFAWVQESIGNPYNAMYILSLGTEGKRVCCATRAMLHF